MTAIASVRAQTVPPAETIVVIDGPDAVTSAALAVLDDPLVRVVELPRSRGAGGARNAGIDAASGRWVAFLDDDDEWEPEKLQKQLGFLRGAEAPDAILLGTQATWVVDDHRFVWPERAPERHERVGDYLFIRRRPGESLMALPTMLLSRELACRHRFPEDLKTHEEWSWYLGLERLGARLHIVMEPLAVVNAPRLRTSVSASSAWQSSLGWGLLSASDLSPRAFSEFCLTEAGRSARRQGSVRGVLAVAAAAMSGAPGWYAVVRFAGMVLLPDGARRRAVALSARIRRRAKR